MLSRRLVLLLVSLCLSFWIVFSAVSINAYAVDTVVKMETQTGISFFGNSLTCNYKYNNTQYTTTLQYSGTISGFRGINVESNDVMSDSATVQSYDCICYKGSTSVPYASFGVMNDVFIDCPIYFSDYARGGFGATSPVGTSTVNDSKNSRITYPDNYVGNFQGISANTAASANLADYYGVIQTNDLNGYSWNWRPILYEVEQATYFDGVYFDNIMANYNGELLFIIWLPYVRGSMTDRPPQTTTTTATSSGGAVTTGDVNVDVNVDVDVDMSETNGLLSDIIDVIVDVGLDIVSGVGNLFLPDDEYLENWVDDMSDVISDAFSDSVNDDTLKDVLLDIGTYGATESLRFPGVTVGGVTYIQPTSVPLNPWGRDITVHIEEAINLVATIAVLNMVMNRVKGVIVGEKVVDVEGDDSYDY